MRGTKKIGIFRCLFYGYEKDNVLSLSIVFEINVSWYREY